MSPSTRRIVRAVIAAIRPRGHGFDQPIDDDVLRDVAFPATERPRVYVCGSTHFVDAAADGLVRLGYDPMWVRTERFGATG